MKLSNLWQGVIISFVVTLVFLYSVVLNLGTPIELARIDTFHVVFTLKHYMNTVFSNNFNQILTVPMFYGFNNSLLFSELLIFEALAILPVYLFSRDIVLSFNILVFLTMFFSVFSMFIFVKYVTQKFWPSILASVIYVFNPFVIGHFPDNLHYYSLQWIPLIFLFFEKSLKEKTNKNIFWMCIFLSLQLVTTVTYSALLTVVLPIFVIIRLWQEKISPLRLINKYTIIGILIFGSITLSINMLYSSYYSKNPINRNLTETAMFSPWVTDLFFTSPNNLLYGSMRDKAMQVFPEIVFYNPEYIERNLFWGIIPVILFAISFFKVRKSDYSRLWFVSVVIITVCVILSFGPRIRFSYDFSLPGLYGFLYQFHPLLQSLRVASRFTTFTFFFLGLVCAFILEIITRKLLPRHMALVSILIIFLVIIEYSSTPWKFNPIADNVKNFYMALESRKDIKVILELPMGNLYSRIGFAGNQFVEANYMFFASTLHSKKLLNGYSSYAPPQYAVRIEYLTVNFPNTVKLEKLKSWGVDAIAIHKEYFYTQSEYDRLKKQIEELNVSKITEQETLVLFNLRDWP